MSTDRTATRGIGQTRILPRRRALLGAGAGFGAALIAVACRGGGREDERARPVAGGAPAGAAPPAIRRGGTLVATMVANPIGFDPMLAHDFAVVNNVYEALLKLDGQYQWQPWLAEAVEQPDDVTMVFRLRDGVVFHDGTAFDADAVAFSMERIRSNRASPRYRDAQEIAQAGVVDARTFRLTLKDVFVPFALRMAGPLGTPVSPSAVRTHGDEALALRPVGTGPFRFEEWQHDSHVRLARFDRYWRTGEDGRPLPYLDRIEWRVITESSARLIALQTGDVQIGIIVALDLPAVERDPNLVLAQQPGFGVDGFPLTLTRPPFDTKPLRQALAYAMDREEWMRVIAQNTSVVAHGPIPPPLAWATDPTYKPYPYDLRMARAKLAEGGRPNGFDFELWAKSDAAGTRTAMELFQAQVAKVGITMNLQYGDLNGVVRRKQERQESNAYWSGGMAGGVDPDVCVSPFLTGNGLNQFPYSNARVDALIMQGRRTHDREARAGIYKEVVRLIQEDLPYVFIVNAVDRFAGSKKVRGWSLTPRLATGSSDLWLAQ